MTKLKKRRKSFEASKETIEVSIEGINYEVANLLNSEIQHKRIVLLAINDVWHEINTDNLGSATSNIKHFKSFVEKFNLTLSDLGIEPQKTEVYYEFKHSDFEQLQEEFPSYNYIQIGKLDGYLRDSQLTTGMYAIRQILKSITQREMTIDNYIFECENTKAEIIKKYNPKKNEMKVVKQIEETPEGTRAWYRLKELSDLVVTVSQNGDFYEGHGFAITTTSIEEDSDEDWNLLMQRITAVASGHAPLAVGEDNQTAIPVPVLEAEVINSEIKEDVVLETKSDKKPVSLQTISNLSPDRISELQGLSALQNKIVEENPFIKITDSKTLKKAKECESILLKASTAIDGKTGILANFVTHTNQFIKMGKDFLNPLAKITRDAYDKQKAERIAYENAEEIRIQKEAKEALEKINARTSRLFDIPMVFNGELYSIGTLFVLPSQIEKSTDEEFEAIVKQGLAIKSALDNAESEKDKEIRELKEKLDKLMLLAGMSNETVASTPPVISEEISTPTIKTASTPAVSAPPVSLPANPAVPTQQSTAPSAPQSNPSRFRPSEIYSEPNEGNVIVSKFDLDHVELISQNPMLIGFVKSRGYFIEGTKQAALKVKDILENQDQSIKKSVAITELCEILLNAKN